MALRFMDSFDHYTGNPSAGMTAKGWLNVSGANLLLSTVTAWGSGNYVYQNGNGTTNFASVTIDNQQQWIVGMMFNPAQSTTYNVINILDGGTGGTSQVSLGINGFQQYTGYRNGTAITSTSPPMQVGVWHNLEFGVLIHPTAGWLTLKIDGVQAWTFTGNTRATSNSFANTIQINLNSLGGGAGSVAHYDDIYILDGTGASNNTFIGPARIATMYPNADSTPQNFTTSSGSTHYNLVNEVGADGDTSYVASSTVGNVDLYKMGTSATLTDNIAGIQLVSYERNDDGLTHTMGQTMLLGGTQYQTSLAASTTTTYAYDRSVVELNPNTTVPFVAADLTNGSFGVKNVL